MWAARRGNSVLGFWIISCESASLRFRSGAQMPAASKAGSLTAAATMDYNSDAEYVFNRVKKVIGNGQSWNDVTEQLIPGSRRPRLRIEWPKDEQ